MEKDRPAEAPLALSARRGRGSEADILRMLDEKTQLTRQQVAELTGLSRSTVADAVARLVEEGVVAESRPSAGGRGRPAQLLRRADPQGLLLGLDFGHNHLGVAVGAPSGQILRERTVDASVDEDPLRVLRQARDVAVELLAEEGTDLSGVVQTAAGMPGPMSVEGVVQIPSLLGNGKIMQPAKALSELLGMPVPTFNDTVLGAYGEMLAGAAVGVEDFIFVKASHGVGAAVVLGGRIHRGADGLAGEIGHTRLQDATARCRCGNRGCMETVAGVDGLAAELPAPYGPESLSSPSVGDPVVDRVVTDGGRAVGAILAPICNALNPALVVTGGVLGSGHADAFVKGVRGAIDQLAQPAIARNLEVVPAALGIRAELVGAVLLARREALR
ncbi:ROK family transcriptional regulator [Ornithinimicrobium avium]|uniref:ROK family transcriptional regulator n=1 Tax=Ornithinimicrobium avium TaxID=2283195 RepID=A0A345NL56_9MICO|nr:ROK family transcriptional regulator [Ornithinimicrobium avium]AXH95764.1 ROK family transcriptional regulator [Ornithinimicrobium avium]